MKALLMSCKGNISMAMVFVLFSAASSSILMFLALYDTLITVSDCRKEQVFLFLRSETDRAMTFLEKREVKQEGFYLPVKTVKVVNSLSNSTYTLQSRMMNTDNINTSGFDTSLKLRILSLVKGKTSANSNSIIKYINTSNNGFCEKYVVGGNLITGFSYFSNNEQTSSGLHYFSGRDVIYGKVHSNSAIWLKQDDGGNNNGWPTFYGPVTTTGMIRSLSGPPPMIQIFRNGYWEYCNPYHADPNTAQIRCNAMIVGPAAYDPNRIMFVTVDGSTFTSYLANICYNAPDSCDVWSQYPPRAGTYLFRNRFSLIDTFWVTGPSGPCSGHSNLVFSKLWIRSGSTGFSGKQTWCSVDTMYISDNIKLAGTQLGQCPDGSVAGSVLNTSDLVGLVSEKSILVQYGYRDPHDSLRYKPNCEQDGVWIYAAIAALGKGLGNNYKDGVFAFEYQHPHPSVPDYRIGNYVYTHIDLHRRRFPQTALHPWPGNIDYPWYNPLWPEGNPTMERGTVHLWGSVYQTRAGYMSRDKIDTNTPNPEQVWNIPYDLCGGPSGNSYLDPVLNVTFACENAPGTTGNKIGYKRDFHHDNRLNHMGLPDFPAIHTLNNDRAFTSRYLIYKKPPRNLTLLES